LREITEVAVEFGGGVEAAELEINLSRAVCEGPGILEVLGGLDGIVG